jgi:hypothetical protein
MSGPIAPKRSRPTRRDIVFHPLSSSEWRVADGRIPGNDLRGLLGFVQRSGELFEVVRMGQPFIRSYCSTLEEAAQQFLRPHTFIEEMPKSLPEVDPNAIDEDELAEAPAGDGEDAPLADSVSS